MKNVLELLINNTKFVANKSKTILAILLITAFVVLLAFIEAYVLTTISVLLGLVLVLPLAFIGCVITRTWFDLMVEWNL
ncbi:MAG TPA: hypothetical protein PLR97_05745 [Bacilli bacterium]|nr:hypothetical protein [Bacilli bacterium]